MVLVNTNMEYLQLTVFCILSIILATFLLLLSYGVSYKKKNDTEKLSSYECGFDPFGTGVSTFEVHFYIVGILFIIFDLEIVFLYPWAIHLGILGGSGFCAVVIFLAILTVGFIYEWQKGALDWSKHIVTLKAPGGLSLQGDVSMRTAPSLFIEVFWFSVIYSGLVADYWWCGGTSIDSIYIVGSIIFLFIVLCCLSFGSFSTEKWLLNLVIGTYVIRQLFGGIPGLEVFYVLIITVTFLCVSVFLGTFSPSVYESWKKLGLYSLIFGCLAWPVIFWPKVVQSWGIGVPIYIWVVMSLVIFLLCRTGFGEYNATKFLLIWNINLYFSVLIKAFTTVEWAYLYLLAIAELIFPMTLYFGSFSPVVRERVEKFCSYGCIFGCLIWPEFFFLFFFATLAWYEPVFIREYFYTAIGYKSNSLLSQKPKNRRERNSYYFRPQAGRLRSPERAFLEVKRLLIRFKKPILIHRDVFPMTVLSILLPWVFGEISLLLVILIFLVFAATKNAFGVRRTLLDKHRLITKYLVFTLTSLLIFFWFHNNPATLVLFSYQHYIISDFYSENIKTCLISYTGFFLWVTGEYLIKYSDLKKINLIEFPIIICFTLFFMLLLVSSFNLFGAYVSLEGVTFSLYILAGMNYNSQNSLEAGMKYFCLGALSSGFLLYGISLVFIMTKSLVFLELRFLFSGLNELPLLLSFGLIFIFFGFWFKLSIFPCHAWTPDVYEGILTPVTFFFATAVKLGIFAFFIRILFFLLGSKLFLFFWQPFFLFVAAASVVVGALGALMQTKIKRFIGYTSINQMGYLLIGISSGDTLGVQASFLYLSFYLIMSFIFFSTLLYIHNPNTGNDILFINQLRQFGRENKNISIILALVLFSMAGVPPLAGFFGKFFLFFSAFKAGNHSLLILGLIMNIISSFYYLRIIKCIFFDTLKGSGRCNYLFFTGSNTMFNLGYTLWLRFCISIFLVFPIFFNKMLLFFDGIAFSVFYINVVLW